MPSGDVREVCRVGGGPNGAAFGPDGTLYICSNGGLVFDESDGVLTPVGLGPGAPCGRIERVNPSTAEAEVVFESCGGEALGAPNDLVFDSHGGCWFTDTLRGVVYYADPVAGSIACEIEGLEAPNGVGLSPDESTLYVAETFSGRLLRWVLTGPGAATSRSVLHSAGSVHGWDSLAVDAEGHVCVANLQGGGITAVDSEGAVVFELTLPLLDRYVTNVCFGGPDLRTAFITSSGRGLLYAAAWPWEGLPGVFAAAAER
jgi:gluconolactonase